jgi:hypothetical protein
MNNLKLMKAQAKLALTRVEARLEVSIVNYIGALERLHELDVVRIEQLKAEIERTRQLVELERVMK